jgi:hypothetical protein
MAADGFTSEDSLDAAQYAQVDRICMDFEQAWLKGQVPALEAFLEQLPGPLAVRSVLFRELLVVELHYRRRQRLTWDPLDYRRRFPQFADLISQAVHDMPPDDPPVIVQPPPAARPVTPDTHHKSADPASSTSRSSNQPTNTVSLPPSVQPLSRWGRYQIVRSLGKGAFGEVFLAKDSQLDRLVAIKICHRELFRSEACAASFLSEARKAAQLSKHPRTVTIHNVGRKDDGYYIVMDYVDGGTLADPASTEKLSLAQIAELVAQVAEAVHYAHTKGLVHRDIKPANILLDSDGSPFVTDFGLAVHESEQDYKKGEISGTPHYMSPEQVTGHTERLDGRTDVWSLGATLYELLTRRRPFSGSTSNEIFDQILHRDVRPPRQINDTIPAELERVCLKALSKQPAMRHSTARDFADDLRRAVADMQPAKTSAATGGVVARHSRPERSSQRRLTWTVYAALAVLLLAGLAGFMTPSCRQRVVEWAQRLSSGVKQADPSRADHDAEDLRPTNFRQTAGFAAGNQSPTTWIDFAQDLIVSGDEEGGVWLSSSEAGAVRSSVQLEGRIRKICVSPASDRVVMLLDAARPLQMRILPLFGEPSVPLPALPAPDTLVKTDRDVAVLTIFPQGLQWRSLMEEGSRVFELGGSWEYIAAASANAHFVVAGYAAEDQRWIVKQGTLDARSPTLSELALRPGGPVCSIDTSERGTVVVGGWNNDVGIQYLRAGTDPQPLCDSDEKARQFHSHRVAIASDDRHVYAASCSRRQSGGSEAVLLRAWYLGEKAEKVADCEPFARHLVEGPLEAAALDPTTGQVVLAMNRELQVLRLARMEPPPAVAAQNSADSEP